MNPLKKRDLFIALGFLAVLTMLPLAKEPEAAGHAGRQVPASKKEQPARRPMKPGQRPPYPH